MVYEVHVATAMRLRDHSDTRLRLATFDDRMSARNDGILGLVKISFGQTGRKRTRRARARCKTAVPPHCGADRNVRVASGARTGGCANTSGRSEVMAIPIGRVKKRWMKQPGFKAGYDALEPEFAIASMLIRARLAANLSQQQVAKRMGTSQSTVARLESASSRPSLTTLERFAKATGTKVRVELIPVVRATKKATKAA